MKVSIFKNAKTPSNPVSVEVEDLLKGIESGKWESITNIARDNNDKLNNDPTNKDLKKTKANHKQTKLPGITFSGEFSHRAKDKLTQSSGLAVIDLDGVKDPSITRDFYFDTYNFIYAAFISPSGNGVKILCKIPLVKNDEEYKKYYKNLLLIFDSSNRDEATKDISRLCFVSYDPEIRKRDITLTTIYTDNKTAPINTVIGNTDIFDYKNKALNIGADMVRTSTDGNKYYTLLRAGRLLGGFIASNLIDEFEAENILRSEIEKKNPTNLNVAYKAIKDSIKFGKLDPITFEQYNKKTDSKNTIYEAPKEEPKKDVNFPIDTLPNLIGMYLKELEDVERYNINVTGSTFIWLMSLIIGNRIELEVFPTWKKSPVLWMAFIAQRGDKKSPTIDAMLYPLKKWDKESYDSWLPHYTEWEMAGKKGEEPIRPQRFIDGGTIEGYMKVHQNNKGGLGLVKDELTGLIKEMEKDPVKESFWLSSWNNGQYSKDTKTQGSVLIDRTFVNLLGGIQPQKIVEFAQSYTDSGLFDRFLFIPFEELPTKEFKLRKKQTDLKDYYEGFIEMAIKSANNLKYNKDRLVYKLEGEGATEFEKVYNILLTKRDSYDKNNLNMRAYMSKIITYFPRIVTIYEFIKNYDLDREFKTYISPESCTKSLQLVNFFIENAEDILLNITSANDMSAVCRKASAVTNKEKAVAIIKSDLGLTNVAISKYIGLSKQRVGVIRKELQAKK